MDFQKLKAKIVSNAYGDEENFQHGVFRHDVIGALIASHPDITERRAEKMYDIAQDTGMDSYRHMENSDYKGVAPNWFTEVTAAAEELADIFINDTEEVSENA